MRLTTLEFVHDVVALPDIHLGYGFPVGSAVATKDVVVPYGVGNDIGCGMIAGLTDLTTGDLGHGRLRRALDDLLVAVPAGESRGQGSHAEPQELAAGEAIDAVAGRAAEAAAYGGSRVADALARPLEGVRRATVAARRQIGTLGSGNHFLEYQADEQDRVWVMIHSGSRGLGGAVCVFYDQLAALLTERWYASAGRKRNDVAFLPVDSFEGRAYLDALEVCLGFAQENRRRMLRAAVDALEASLAGVPIDVHHNLASLEHHGGKNLWVHRKGATRARRGELVAIPGSMETGSYICEGLGEPRALTSSSHGAGRRMSRTAARKERSTQAVQASLAAAGILLASPNPEGINDEGGHGYKDIHEVMSNQTDLVRPIHRLRPLGVLKG
jgi:tRNA-splicing ligase RtcB